MTQLYQRGKIKVIDAKKIPVTLAMIQREFEKLYGSMLSGVKFGHISMANNIEKLAGEYRRNLKDGEADTIFVFLARAMSAMDANSIGPNALKNKHCNIGAYLEKAKGLLPYVTEAENDYYFKVTLWATDLMADELDD